ncbi:hypothetical protein RHECNPAF_13300114 [Rhizobium etli CNPAF512]|nr:hypothetical protein RHECNPAF_13300114 [Rhizobium etli CNPAF512]
MIPARAPVADIAIKLLLFRTDMSCLRRICGRRLADEFDCKIAGCQMSQ